MTNLRSVGQSPAASSIPPSGSSPEERAAYYEREMNAAWAQKEGVPEMTTRAETLAEQRRFARNALSHGEVLRKIGDAPQKKAARTLLAAAKRFLRSTRNEAVGPPPPKAGGTHAFDVYDG